MKKKTSTIRLMLAIIIAKLVGMIRDVVLANYYGTTNISDAFLIALSIPTLLYYFVGNAISTAYLPIYNKIKTEKGTIEGLKYSNNLLWLSMLCCIPIIALLLIFPQSIIKIFAAGFDAETISLTTEFMNYASFSLLFMTIVSILTGYLQSRDRFIVPALVSLPRNITIMVAIVVSTFLGKKILGVGMLLALGMECLLLIPVAIYNKYKIVLHIDVHSEHIRETLYMGLPIVLGVGVSQINKIVDKSIASTVTAGGISALSYAAVINNSVQEVLVTGIITVLFAKCSQWVSEGKYDIVKKKLLQTIEAMSVVLVPATLGVIILSELIVKCILCRGVFDNNSVSLTSGALIFYIVGLPFLAIRDTLIKVFYAYKETKIPTRVSVIGIVINIVLNFIFAKYMGISGLALATSVSSCIQCILLYYLLKRKIGAFLMHNGFKTIICVIVSSIAMVFAIIPLRDYLIMREIADFNVLIICTLVGVIIYTITAIILKTPFIISYLSSILGKISNKKRG